jgi:acetyl-CoA carboxylase biotin carboxyl carrier protein
VKETKSPKKLPGGPAKAASRGPMDPALLQELVKLMAANDLNTLEVRDGDQRITLKRGPAVAKGPVVVAQPAAIAAPGPAVAAPAAAKPPEDPMAGYKEIKSPMVGTFYSKPSPDAKPFVQVGSPVSEETDVCIIEAMKVFNNIKAECRGTIARICFQDGQSVEFGSVLYLVKP